MKSILTSKWIKASLFLLCLVPFARLVWRALHQRLGANPIEFITHETGDWTLIFLLVTLAVTPARRLLRRPELIRFRRMLGLFAFFYGFLHFSTWMVLDKFFDLKDMLHDVYKRPFITAGFTGFVLLIPLALTSTAGWVRRMGGKGWQRLHRLIYASAIAGVVHYYWLVKSDVRKPVFYGALLAVLLVYRLGRWLLKKATRARTQAGPNARAEPRQGSATPTEPRPEGSGKGGKMAIKASRLVTVALLLVLASLTGLSLRPQISRRQSRPPQKLNVLFIAVDDLNTDLHCYGHPVVKSPNIDRLAAGGVQFDRAYCQYPLCNPSRTSLLSGRRPDATQIFDNTTPPRTHLKDVVFLPEYFRQHGYFTARVGKIAHGLFEDSLTWDVSQSAVPGNTDRDEEAGQARRQQRAGAGEGGLKLQWRATNNKDEDEPDGRVARRIAQLLEENKNRTFFIAAGFHKPHLPWVAPKKYFDLYPPDTIRLPQEPADDRKDIPPIALTHTAGDDEMTDAQKRQAIAAYYAATSFMDAQVGIVIDALDRLKLKDNTVVVLFGDHGFHLGEHGGLWRKMTLFEEAARAPLIVFAPGKRAGVRSPRLVEFVDLYPTLTELCGLPTAEKMEGTSFVPLLEDPKRPWKKAAFTVVQRGRNQLGRSVGTERYRYTDWGEGRGMELYDHQTDPHEYVNLADQPKYARTVAELRRLLQEGWQAAVPKSDH